MTTGWVNSMEWTEAEEAEVVRGFMRHGTSWRRIRAEFNFHRSRTEEDIMYRWRGLCTSKGFLAQHASALIAMLAGADIYLRKSAASELDRLDPATMAQRVDVQVALHSALETLGKLDQATIVLHANAVVAMLKDTSGTFEVSTTGVGQTSQVRVAALAPLSALPHYLIRGTDLDDFHKRVLASKHARELSRDSREFEELHSLLLGRLQWYRCRLRWRVQRLVLYWYALPYRPSGPGHARDVEAWDRMVGSRDERQTTSTSSAKKRQIEITDWLLGSAASRTSTNLAKRDRRHQAQK